MLSPAMWYDTTRNRRRTFKLNSSSPIAKTALFAGFESLSISRQYILFKLFSHSKSGKCMWSFFFSAKAENVPRRVFTRFFATKYVNIPGTFHKKTCAPQALL